MRRTPEGNMSSISAAQAACAPVPGPESAVEVSVVMPCLNEAETVADCIGNAQRMLREHGYSGEVVIADNGSTDGSQAIAEALGARVVAVKEKGYGSALSGGISASRGRYIVMADADGSYDFGEAPRLVDRLRSGCDLVMGNRFRGGVKPRAMPSLHRYLGNPVLTWLGRLFFKAPCADFHCGLRAFSREAFDRMDLRTVGMEFASEMVVKATLFGMRIGEEPVTLSPDGRSRPPHLRSWRDGWRHLRFLLLYSPRWLFLYPGTVFFFAGLFAMLWLVPANRMVGGVSFGVHTMIYAAMAMLVGFQAVAFATFTKIFAISERLLPPDPRLGRVAALISLEVGLIAGALLILSGLAGSVYAVEIWAALHYGRLEGDQLLRIVIPAATAVTIGVQTVLCSFFLSVLGMRRR
jgi:glycosyltransferase involved in cell wall biosynthesis